MFSKKTFVGLDLGHHTFKAMQLERSSGGWKITRSGSVVTPADCVKDGVIVDSLAATVAIKQLLKEDSAAVASGVAQAFRAELAPAVQAGPLMLLPMGSLGQGSTETTGR